MRISLRELMIVVAVAAVGMAGLKYADTAMLTVVQAMSGLLLLTLMVRAAVDRGRGQAFAIGFVVCGIAYLVASIAAMTGCTGVSSFGTVTSLQELHKVFLTERWYNEATNQLAVNFQATQQEQQADRTTRLELQPWTPTEATAADADVAKDVSTEEVVTMQAGDSGAGAPMGRGRGGRGGRSGEPGETAFGGVPQSEVRGPDLSGLTAEQVQQLVNSSGRIRGSRGSTPEESSQLTAGRRGGGRTASGLTVEEAQQMFGGGGGGGGGGRGVAGRGGGGRGRGSISSQLSSQQLNEYVALDTNRQRQLSEILSRRDGLAAIQSGRPLATINLVAYVRRISPSYDNFEQAGRCLWTLLIGYVGGLVARFFYSRRTAPGQK